MKILIRHMTAIVLAICLVSFAAAGFAEYATLQRGDTGEAVTALQKRLDDLKYMPGTVDGNFGKNTYNAVRRFQATKKISQTGIATSMLQQSLFDAKAPKYDRYVGVTKGTKGIRVEDIQVRLRALGYPYVRITGRYDSLTDKAMKIFQFDNGFEQVSKATTKHLHKLYGSAHRYTKYVLLQFGDEGTRVNTMQKRLKKLKYPIIKATSVFDDETENAVKLFQERAGLEADGIATVKTLKKLYAKKAPKYEQPDPTPTPEPTPTPTPAV